MKILILGISSFVGFNISNQLIKKYKVTGTITKNYRQYKNEKKLRLKKLNNKIKIFQCNIDKPVEIKNIIQNELPDIVINATGYTKNYANGAFDQKKGFKTNVQSLKNIIKPLEKIKKNSVLYFNIGSAWEYSQNIEFCKESSRKQPTIPYGLQKLQSTNTLRKMYKKNTKIIILRLFNIFGQLDNPKKIFNLLINNLKSNKISKLSSATQMRDYIHVNDLAKAIDAIIKNKNKLKNFEIFNICRGMPIAIKNIVFKICKILGKKKNLVEFDLKKNRSFENQIFFGCNKKITRLTNWKPLSFGKSLQLLVKK